MTEQQGGQNGGQQQDGATPPEPKPFTPISSQDDLNRIIADRVARERGKFADYNDLKAKAGRLDEIEQANKSEIEKAAERAAAAERERDEAKATALRLRIAAKHGISDEHADLFLNGTDEATLTRQAEQLVQFAESPKKRSNHVPREGTTPASGSSDEVQFAQSLFNGGD